MAENKAPEAAREERMKLAGFDTYVSAGADFDEPERVYRYRLWREWEAAPRRVLWVMLNPSTADEHVLDPTLRRCEGFTRAWGYGGFTVVNLFALRATDPAALYDHASPVGELDGGVNDDAIRWEAGRARLIVVGWGAERLASERAKTVAFLLREFKPHCLGMNRDGSPKHPLYLAASTPLVPYD